AASGLARVRAGKLVVEVRDGPPTVDIRTRDGATVQRLVFDAAAPGMSFLLGNGPLLGLGEGGPQFDRKGSVDRMIIGQGGYRLATHGTRAPIQWLVGTDGWAMFIHQPFGAFDFTGADGKFTPPTDSSALYDVFVVSSREPAVIMREYARITGLPEMPARWAFGYQQSHRTLAGPDEIASVARTLREKKLPCDTLIYLGTEFAPSGWNTRNGEFTWHPTNFPEPKKQLAALHGEHFKVVVHVVIEGRRLTGTVDDTCTAPPLPSGRTTDNRWPPDRQVSCYWPFHKSVMDDGVDGWWPDQGDGFDGPSELNRHRMYWEGTQRYRPNERPFALHRNASAGVQRYGGLIWSGDVQSRWETLKTHVPVAINTGLSGLPYWGTDIGGFIPTVEYTGELYARWFQFAAFCPVFRSHGRNWHLHLPWGWDGGDGGPPETNNFKPDPAELHNAEVEPICRKYLELRYRLMPYLYTAVRDCHDTGMPIMRALWLHHPDDAAAVARGDEYLWGRDILVAPVVEKGASSRRLYLPRGTWFDFWTEEHVDGSREIERAVDLATLPLYVRAGAILPMGPVKQYTDEPSDEPMTIAVYPGADGGSTWYEDDGHSFNYAKGEWMRVSMTWRDGPRRLSLRLVPGSRMLPPLSRPIDVRIAGSTKTTRVMFTGKPVSVTIA
ncbi:MAG TPA: TIM-barrel domain-containing protein, partial [Gemmatimonadaceae bacterium]|nr:TIM-barrel domain-containing protein [Gemmatimonadaceae bacterium]